MRLRRTLKRQTGFFALGLLLAGVGCGDSEAPGPLSCPDGQVLCESLCVDPSNDPLNCGGCGEACGPGEVCGQGACDTSCPPELTDCSGSCRDLQVDNRHCGACGEVCSAGEVCEGGVCGFNCPPGQTACGGLCVSVENDRDNCGGCGVACSPDEVCGDGACRLFCPSDLVECDGSCRDVDVDRANCGGCGVVCGDEAQCVGGNCVVRCEGTNPDECNGSCTNVLRDPVNCGACGNACARGEVCADGACRLECGPGQAQCGQTCTSTLTDPVNCGACGLACTTTASGAVGVCVGGGCSLTCRTGFDDCDNDLVLSGGNGCEVDLTNDVNNCGACDEACVFANGAGVCTSSQCTLTGCDMGFRDCNGLPDDGCEAQLATDPRNCGRCSDACAALESCQNGACTFTPGENCGSALPLQVGTSTYGWTAMTADYLTARPFCVSAGQLSGPDVLFTYTSTIDGFLTIQMSKPNNNRSVFVVSDEPCGNAGPGDLRLCVSQFGGVQMGGTVRVVPGRDYTVYFRDTTSGGAPLPNPLELAVSAVDCGVRSVGVTLLSPAPTSTTTSLDPVFAATFQAPIDPSTGTIRITGDRGTNLTYDLAAGPSEVTIGADGTVLTIDPGLNFPPGENLSISATLRDALCGNPVSVPAWQVRVITPPCAPGIDGMVGSTVARISTGINVATEYYVAADTSSTGYVYVGGLIDLQRVPKAGGPVEDVQALAGLTGLNLGYEMLIDGLDIYTINNSGGRTNRVFRISRNGGATWSVLDAVAFPTTPTDDFRAGELYRGRIYLMTHEGTSLTPTQVWSFPAGVATATVARLETTFVGETNCSGLAVDDDYFYAACGGGERLIRVQRTTGAITLLTTQFDLSSTNNSMYGVDLDQDGATDIIYLQTWFEEGYFVCDPGQAAPFFGRQYDAGGANTNYGLGFDRVRRLFAFDDDNGDVLIVE